MKKNGFTLAEVLITLAIVGLIASLTLPGLNSNINNRRIGPALAKAINNLENANKMILAENETVTIDENGLNGYFTNLADTLNASRDANTFIGKDGIAYTFEDTPIPVGASSRVFSGVAYRVGIDVNGLNKQPNLGNSDRFLVYVDTRGAVIPAGGNLIERYANNDSWKGVLEHCQPNMSVPSIRGHYGMCTEAVINAGWEVQYIPVEGTLVVETSRALIPPSASQE